MTTSGFDNARLHIVESTNILGEIGTSWDRLVKALQLPQLNEDLRMNIVSCSTALTTCCSNITVRPVPSTLTATKEHKSHMTPVLQNACYIFKLDDVHLRPWWANSDILESVENICIPALQRISALTFQQNSENEHYMDVCEWRFHYLLSKIGPVTQSI